VLCSQYEVTEYLRKELARKNDWNKELEAHLEEVRRLPGCACLSVSAKVRANMHHEERWSV
jgi:hypothetical protein